MSSSKPVFLLIVFALFAGGLGQILYRHFTLGVPLIPSAQRDVWFIDANIEFDALNRAVTVSLALPESQVGYTLIRENLISPGYGVSVITKNNIRRAEWTISKARGKQKLYYKIQIAADNHIVSPPLPAPPEQSTDLPLLIDDALQQAIDQIVVEASKKSADPLSFTRQILEILTSTPPQQNVELLRESFDPADLLITFLTQGGISSRHVHGLELEDGRRRQRLKDYVQVYANKEWHLFDPRTGAQGRPKNLLLWAPGASSMLDVSGGKNSSLTFSILLQEQNALSSVLSQMNELGQERFSIYRLPLEDQALLKGMFLIPIGAFVVVFMRILVGIRTSGTFMPVLLALAFIQTELIPGLISFVLIVSAGLFVRSYLSRINLLLVPRISATIIVVVGLIILFTLLSERMGFEKIHNFAFFPLIIMSWTIERMSILWEEDGPKEVLIQGLGSLGVASLAYTLMATPIIRHLSFNFLGLQPVLLSFILLMGQYTGYRLTELRRFRFLAGEK